MILNRALQQEILIQTANAYPFALGYEELSSGIWINTDQKELARELQYLVEHGLLQKDAISISLDNQISLRNIKITKDGIDFLQADGGLSAILNVVTVRFEADTLTALLTTKINQSDLPEDEKNSLVEAVKDLPAEGMKQLMTRVLDKGIDSIPNLVPYLMQTLSNM